MPDIKSPGSWQRALLNGEVALHILPKDHLGPPENESHLVGTTQKGPQEGSNGIVVHLIGDDPSPQAGWINLYHLSAQLHPQGHQIRRGHHSESPVHQAAQRVLADGGYFLASQEHQLGRGKELGIGRQMVIDGHVIGREEEPVGNREARIPVQPIGGNRPMTDNVPNANPIAGLPIADEVGSAVEVGAGVASTTRRKFVSIDVSEVLS